MDFNTIEARWRAAWETQGVFVQEPSNKKKKYITAAFPYPNSPQHIGHGRTYTTADVYARFLRLNGFNVLFPMAFHVTGTPIIAMARRIAEKDEEVLFVFETIYGISRDKAAKLTRPEDLVMHFSREIEEGMHEMGYSIDWRRKFYSFDAKFNRFIQWQFRKLKEYGYLVQGEYPIAWCPKDNQAVGGHDTKGDVDPELKEFTAVKFAFEDGFILTATLRPETIYGVTNIWVNPEIMHVRAKSKKTKETYYISKKAYEKMNMQGFELEVLEEFKGEKIINKKVKNPVTDEEVPIYPGAYVKEDAGTGIVMSVPSHAPYDHIALIDMGIKLRYEKIIQVEGHEFMALELIDERKIKNQHDERLEDIVKEVYKKEILTGIMLIGPYKGERVSLAIEKTKNDMLSKEQAVVFWEISNKPVYCRCGIHVTVNIIKNQWFIDYGNETWKEKARACLKGMTIVPEKTRHEYGYAIEWFKQKPCTRNRGLGTRFPFDEKLVIEALSDSTIYMAFYTFAHLLGDIDEKEMGDEFFDYVLHGKGTGKPAWKKLRESFLYWYPCDSRHSGADLVRNHLPFYIFNHVALFPEGHWPKQIATNGFVLMDGKKMSKSMGNILPLRKAIREYGADVIRFSIVSGAEITQDTDFNKSVAEGTKSRLEFIMGLVERARDEKKGKDDALIEKWLASRLNKKIKLARTHYENFSIRELSLELFYDVVNDLQWYLKRTASPQLREFLKTWSIVISPVMPHIAEEIWHMLGGKELVVQKDFPESDEKKINEDVEHGEELIKETRADIENVIKLTGKKPARIFIYTASDWKHALYKIVGNEKAMDKIMKVASADPVLKQKMNDVQRVTRQLVKNAYALPKTLGASEEEEALSEACEFFKNEFSCEILVKQDSEGTHEKAKNAIPGKPAIVLE